AAEEYRCLDLVTFVQETQHVIFLGLIVVIIHIDAEFHFLDRNRLLVLLGLALFFFLLVKLLPVIHDAAYRRICGGRNLNQIQILLAGHLERFEGRHDSNLLAFVANYANFAGADALVRANKAFVDTVLRSLASEWEWKIITCGELVSVTRSHSAVRMGFGLRTGCTGITQDV